MGPGRFRELRAASTDIVNPKGKVLCTYNCQNSLIREGNSLRDNNTLRFTMS